MTPAITIGIMTHNYGRYIREAIDSVLAQSRTDWELIISDDASSDGTKEIVVPYLADPRITYVRHAENLGQSRNWGFLLGQGTAPVLAVLHADDHWLPGTLEAALSAFAADPELDLFYGDWLRLTEGGPEQTSANRKKPHIFSGYEEYDYQIRQSTCLPSVAFLTRRVIMAAGLPDVTLNMIVDYEYLLRICTYANKVQASAQTLTLYRVHSKSTTAESTKNGVLAEERSRLVSVCSAWAGDPKLRPGLRRLHFNLSRADFSEGINSIMYGDLAGGRRLMRRGLTSSPVLLIDPKVLIDCILCLSGKIGLRIFRGLHSARLEATSDTQ